jgi:4-amino-4-deoxy-L-arabinose transferase-like glycosyltransferase
VTPRRFVLGLAALTLAGFLVRLGYGLVIGGEDEIGDDTWYHLVANNLVDGRGFSDPFTSLVDGQRVAGTQGEPIATAFHLPMFPWLLAALSKAGLDGYTTHQAFGWLLGAGTVACAGLLARRLWDARAGLAAAAIAAFYPPLVANDSVLMSESLYGLAAAAVLLLALRLPERPGWRASVALGVALAVAALTRQEALVLAALLLPWIAVRARPRDAVVVAVTVAVLCAPWAIRNSAQYDRPVLLTTGDGSVLAGANLPTTYHGSLLGGWDFVGLYRTPAGRTVVLNEAEQSNRWRREGLDYAGDHAGRLPVVMGARVLRTWGFYPFDPLDRADVIAFHGGRIRTVEVMAYPALLLVIGLAVAGFVALRRRGAPLWPLVANLLLVVAVSAFGYGDPRFAQAANVVMVVLAGVGVVVAADAAISRRRRRAGRPASEPDQEPRAGAAAPRAT